MNNICSNIVGEADRDSALTHASLKIIAENFGFFMLKFFGQAARLLSTAGAVGTGIDKLFSILFLEVLSPHVSTIICESNTDMHMAQVLILVTGIRLVHSYLLHLYKPM
jgi:hypothetical protein